MKYLQILGVIAISLIIGFGVGNMNIDSCEADVLGADVAELPTGIDVSGGVTDDGHYFLGATNAPITMIEYTDYQCPYCQSYFMQTFESIKRNYIDTGKVKYIVKDLPLDFHPNAFNASTATRCAGEQELYWEMHEKIFLTQSDWSGSSNIDEVLTGYAKNLGANTDDFASCLVSGKYNTQIAADMKEASSVGISGTPSFTVNGFLAVGAQPYKNFVTMFDRF